MLTGPEHLEERARRRLPHFLFEYIAGGSYDEQTFVVKTNGQSGFLDHESLKPEKINPDVAAQFATVNIKKGGALIVHGWTMAEDLVKLGAR